MSNQFSGRFLEPIIALILILTLSKVFGVLKRSTLLWVHCLSLWVPGKRLWESIRALCMPEYPHKHGIDTHAPTLKKGRGWFSGFGRFLFLTFFLKHVSRAFSWNKVAEIWGETENGWGYGPKGNWDRDHYWNHPENLCPPPPSQISLQEALTVTDNPNRGWTLTRAVPVLRNFRGRPGGGGV